MSARAASLNWHWYAPLGHQVDAPHAFPGEQWLEELSEMRGRVLYDGGRRPTFRLTSGRFTDRDPLDRSAFHIIARHSHELVGCVRVIPLARIRSTVTETLLGSSRFDAILEDLGARRERCVEGGRWVVVAEHRSLAVGMRLIAGLWAMARGLGFQDMLATVGSRDGQDVALRRTGARHISELGTVHSPTFDDQLRFMHFDFLQPSRLFASLISEMASELGLSGVATAAQRSGSTGAALSLTSSDWDPSRFRPTSQTSG